MSLTDSSASPEPGDRRLECFEGVANFYNPIAAFCVVPMRKGRAMASGRHVHRPSIRPRLRWTATNRKGTAASNTAADSSTAMRAAKARRGRGVVRAAFALALIALTFLLLPGQVQPPSGAPGNSPSLDRMSTVALYTTPYGGEEFSTHLSWSWRIQGGKSEPSLFATIDSRVARGSLVLGGPIANLVSECHLNGEHIDP